MFNLIIDCANVGYTLKTFVCFGPDVLTVVGELMIRILDLKFIKSVLTSLLFTEVNISN